MSLGIFQLLSFILLMDPGEVISGPPQAKDVPAQSLDEFRQRYLLPLISSDTRNCSLNACESLGIVSQLLMLINSMPNGTHTTTNGQKPPNPKVNGQGNGDGNSGEINAMSHLANFDLVKRVRQIESRLRSVEQPIWHLATGSQIEWNHCTSGVCRCNPDTKSFTCWNTNLKSVPVTQVIPMNMVNMWVSQLLLWDIIYMSLLIP